MPATQCWPPLEPSSARRPAPTQRSLPDGGSEEGGGWRGRQGRLRWANTAAHADRGMKSRQTAACGVGFRCAATQWSTRKAWLRRHACHGFPHWRTCWVHLPARQVTGGISQHCETRRRVNGVQARLDTDVCARHGLRRPGECRGKAGGTASIQAEACTMIGQRTRLQHRRTNCTQVVHRHITHL